MNFTAIRQEHKSLTRHYIFEYQQRNTSSKSITEKNSRKTGGKYVQSKKQKHHLIINKISSTLL